MQDHGIYLVWIFFSHHLVPKGGQNIGILLVSNPGHLGGVKNVTDTYCNFFRPVTLRLVASEIGCIRGQQNVRLQHISWMKDRRYSQ